MRRVAEKPRPHPDGGWYCEQGRAFHDGCERRAVWVLASCADDPGRYPGGVVCTEHANGPRVGHVRYVPLLAVVPPPEPR